jgi:hypothetical protein
VAAENSSPTGAASPLELYVNERGAWMSSEIKKVSGGYKMPWTVPTDVTESLIKGGALKKSTSFEDVEAQAVSCYHMAQEFGKCHTVAVWRAGEALKSVYHHFMTRKAEIRANGHKLRDERQTWTSWMEDNDINATTAGRYIRVYEQHELKEVVGKQLLELTGYRSLEQYQKNPYAEGTVVKLRFGQKLSVDGKDSMFHAGSCFKILDASKAEADDSVTVEILTGKNKTHQMGLSVRRLCEMSEIKESEVKEPVVPPKKPRRERSTATMQPVPPPKPQPFKLDTSAAYRLTEDFAAADHLQTTSALTVNLASGTYVGVVERTGKDTFQFFVLSGEQAGKMFSGDVRKVIAKMDSYKVAQDWAATGKEPPQCFPVEINLALGFLHQAAGVIVNSKRFTALESAFLYTWKNRVKHT